MSNRKLFIEPEDFDLFREHFRIRAEIQSPTGMVNTPLSRPFESIEDAQNALLTIQQTIPNAGIYSERVY